MLRNLFIFIIGSNINLLKWKVISLVLSCSTVHLCGVTASVTRLTLEKQSEAHKRLKTTHTTGRWIIFSVLNQELCLKLCTGYCSYTDTCVLYCTLGRGLEYSTQCGTLGPVCSVQCTSMAFWTQPEFGCIAVCSNLTLKSRPLRGRLFHTCGVL